MKLKDPYDNDDLRGGVLLLSYPCIESYIISNFISNTYNIDLALGIEAKSFITMNNFIQINNIKEDSIKKAVLEFKKYIENEDIDFNIDKFSSTNKQIFNKQEKYYYKKSAYKTLSLLTIAFLQLGIISFE